MSQLSPKNKNKNFVKTIVASEILLSCFDDLNIGKDNDINFHLGKVTDYLEDIVDAGYKHPTVRGSNDMQQLVKKVDTLIRKNLQ